ncbi:hypothetical protein QBC39DRAFT_364631 [Podospora conica]|nr:hypothetical protein QBC39DRAFT_364631 [Schizothecium conicum]
MGRLHLPRFTFPLPFFLFLKIKTVMASIRNGQPSRSIPTKEMCPWRMPYRLFATRVPFLSGSWWHAHLLAWACNPGGPCR